MMRAPVTPNCAKYDHSLACLHPFPAIFPGFSSVWSYSHTSCGSLDSFFLATFTVLCDWRARSSEALDCGRQRLRAPADPEHGGRPGGQDHDCSDGADALAAYTRHRPDFVLMDIQMRVMDGITATQRIKADPAARIIIVTDYDQDDLREAAQQAGACGYVAKENLPELVRLLSRFESL